MRRLLALAVAAVAVVAAVALCTAALPASANVAPEQIDGSGSSWAANAVNQWVADMVQKGRQVVYTPSGSAQGRSDFKNRTTDFGVSDIGFQGVDVTSGSDTDTNCTGTPGQPGYKATCRPYAYLPIVAGGTSFPYQIRVGGQLMVNLRLSGKTLAEIFTNKITNWDDPAITKDNNGFPNLPGHRLPSLQIIPVVHSEGSGSTAQFTRYLATEYPTIWHPFSGGVGQTEYFPNNGHHIAVNGSDGVFNEVSAAAANGAIGYDEYSYAKQKNWPVALLENAGGYFTAPTEYNVAVALTKAKINMTKSSPDYLLQNLDKVYTNSDPRAYAMSSYSYMIIPTSSTDQRMTTGKRQTLADFIDWSICGGQGEIGPIGYSALPINLVEASFAQMNKLHTADKGVQLGNENVSTCNNPTFVPGNPNLNHLAQIALPPPSCDKLGQGPCPGWTGVGSTGNPKNGKPPPPTVGPSSPTTSASSGTSHTASAGVTPSGGTTTSPAGGSVPGGPGSTAPGGGTGTGTLAGSPTNIAESDNSSVSGVLGALAGIELLLLLAIPPLIARRRQQRRTGR